MELIGLKDKIESYLDKNKRSLSYMESLFSIDDNRDREEEFYKEGKLKVLCVYLTPASSRAVSNTHNALSSLSKKLDPENILVDSCYFPEDSNIEMFQSAGIPFIFGSTCHEPIGFYDMVLMSNAVCPEVLNIPRFLTNSGVGLTIEQRDKQDIPLIYYGGAAANETSIVLGPIYRDGECIGKSLIDVGTYGYGEKSLATLAKTMLGWKRQGIDLHDKPALKEKMINEKLLSEYLFYAEHYEWVYADDKFTIKEIKCLDDRLPKQVKYARIRLNEDMGWTNKAFNLSGDNADSHDLMISSGCSGGSSNCSFKRPKGTRLPLKGYGLVKIEDVVGLNGNTDKFLNEDYDALVTDIVECGEEDIWRVRLSSGTEIRVSDQHLMQVQNYNTWDDVTKKVNDVQVGDWMLLKLGTECFGDYQNIPRANWDNSKERKPECIGDLKCDEEVALLLGFIQGDGSVTLRECGNSTDRLQVFMKGKEVDVIHPILNRLFGVKELRVHYTQKDGTEIMVYQRCGDSVRWLYESTGISSGKINRVPDIIFRSPKSVIQSYLKGLFQADGWSTNSQLNVRRGQMGLTQISYEFLQDVQKLLLMCGIYSHVSERESVYIKDGYNNRRPAHYVMVSNEFVNKFKQEIGFIDKNMEEFKYRDCRCVPVPTLRNLIKYQRDLIPKDSIRRIDDQTHSGFISIKNLKLLLEWGLELPRIYKAIAEGNYYPVQVKSVEKTSERVICYTTNVEPLHKICYDMVYEHNCMEATVAGGYREKKLEDVEEEMKHTVRNCAPNTISWYCMAGDTKVLTDDGYQTLRSLVGTKGRVNTTQGMSDYQEVVSTGVKKTLKITTDRGYQFEATPEHWLRVLDTEFDYENYKPKASDTKNSECLNYLAGKKFAEGVYFEEQVGNNELSELNEELYNKMLDENSYVNQRAFIAGYIQNGGSLPRIRELIDRVTGVIVPLQFGWKQLGEFKVGDHICIYSSDVLEEYKLEPLYYIAGRWYGDGSTPSKYNLMLHFSYDEEEDLNEVVKMVGEGVSSVREGSGTKYIIFTSDYSRRIKEIISNKEVSPLDIVGRADYNCKASFVAGLWDSDGTVSGGKCRFASIREQFIRDLQVLLLDLGIYSRFDKTKQDGFYSDNEYIYGVTVSGKRSYNGFSKLPVLRKKYSGSGQRIGRDRDVFPIKAKVFKEIGRSKYRQLYSEQSLTSQLLEDLCEENNFLKEVVEDYRLQNMHFDKIVSIEENVTDTYDIIHTDTADYIAGGVVQGQSYNLNYYYRFMDLLATGANYFSGVTLLNERLDVVANSPDQMKLAKKLGLKRFSGPVEGAGERIRDGFLNKNLSRDTLMKATHVISDLGLMHFKFGMILTGQETEEDMKDFLSEIDEMIKIRDEHGANHSYQINWTPLVFYSQIALRWMPRITAENSYNNARTMSWFIEETRKRNIRCKFNGKGCGTWLEQMLLDFGPAGTDWMVGLVLDEGMGYIRFFGDKIKEASCRQLDKRGYTDHLFFTKARPDDWIFPNDHIASIPDALSKQWLERTHAWNNGDPQAFHRQLCLRTPANMNDTKCYGCKMCETPEEIKYMVKREFADEHTYDEVAEMLSESREQKTVRVVVKQNSKWFFYNRTALAHYITSRFLQANDEIANQFFSVGKTTTTWLSNNGQKGWYGGTWCYDINLRDRVSIEEFNKVIDVVNSELESAQVLRVIDDTKTMKVKRETKISYIGQTTVWSLSQIKDKLSMFNWDIRVPIKSMGGQLDTEAKYLPELKEKVLFAQKGSGVIIGMDLPASISPYFVMSSILGKGYEKMLADFSFDIIDQTADTDMVDNKGQHIGYSYFVGEYNKLSNIQAIRRYLYILTH